MTYGLEDIMSGNNFNKIQCVVWSGGEGAVRLNIKQELMTTKLVTCTWESSETVPLLVMLKIIYNKKVLNFFSYKLSSELQFDHG